MGFDYLYSKPSDFINNVPKPVNVPNDVKFYHVEEMTDFSVYEIDFNKVNDTSYGGYGTAQKMAKAFSSNYANRKEKDKFKPAQKSLINDSESRKKDFYDLGFPQEEAIGESRTTSDVALFINRHSTLSNDKKSDDSKLVEETHYNTFKDTPGIFAFFICSADFGYKLNPISNTVSSGGIIPYIYQDLAIQI